MSDHLTDLTTRLQRLEDLQAINQLFIDYGRHLDAGDFDSYAELFADDGEVLLGPLGRAIGRKAIRELMTTMLAGKVGESLHIVTSPIVNLTGDTATSSVMWTVMHRAAGGEPVVTMVGRHEDALVRERGQWKIQRRRGFVDMPSNFRPRS